MTDYVYTQPGNDLWTVGFYTPDGVWIPESDHKSPESAARRLVELGGPKVNVVDRRLSSSGGAHLLRVCGNTIVSIPKEGLGSVSKCTFGKIGGKDVLEIGRPGSFTILVDGGAIALWAWLRSQATDIRGLGSGLEEEDEQ